MRETDEEAEVVPNLMIGFGIDEVQAEYVAEIKLRHLNREYILKRTEEIEELENAIADLEDILQAPGTHQQDHHRRSWPTSPKSTASPAAARSCTRCTCRRGARSRSSRFPITPCTCSSRRDGYFKKITPQSLRMSGEQKLKDGDEVIVHLREHEQRRAAVLHEPSSGLQVPRLRFQRQQGERPRAITSPAPSAWRRAKSRCIWW